MQWKPATGAGPEPRSSEARLHCPDLHPDVDWTQPPPQYDGVMKEYTAFAEAAVAVLRGGNALCPTATATTVRVAGGKGGDVITSGGSCAGTKEALTGFYLLECADLDEAVAVAAKIPAARDGAAEVRPVIKF